MPGDDRELEGGAGVDAAGPRPRHHNDRALRAAEHGPRVLQDQHEAP